MAVRGLGKGLDSLIPNTIGESKKVDSKKEDKSQKEEANAKVYVNITKVEPNREQPRKKFDEDSLQELSDSIKQKGVLVPVMVKEKDGYYQIIAGERRWRAAKLAGLKEIPVDIRNDLTDQDIVEISLIENIQRENLNPIEEAQAYKRLLEEFHLKQDELAEKVSKNRTTITNSMRLLKLCDEVQQMVIDEMISTGHARAILSVEDNEQQFEIAQRIFDEKMSVRDVEKLVKNLNKPKTEKNKNEKNKSLEYIYEEVSEKLKDSLGTKVHISAKDNGSGKIEIEFFNHEDFDRLIELLTN